VDKADGRGGTLVIFKCRRRRNLMDSYTITIAPNDDSGAATRLVVDASGDQVRITDVHLHAPQGLSSGHIPTVDFDLLLQAVTGTVTAPNGAGVAGAAELSAPRHSTPALGAAVATEPADEPAEVATTPAAPKRRARKATGAARPARGRAATAASADETPAPRRSARGAATSTARTAPAKTVAKAARAKTAAAPAGKRAAAPAGKRAAAPAKKQAPAKRTRAADTTAPGRVYRRTPDDLAAVFEQVETVAGVAAHYQVPRHTAQGWVSRLRATT
jgi:hypothetical protein